MPSGSHRSSGGSHSSGGSRSSSSGSSRSSFGSSSSTRIYGSHRHTGIYVNGNSLSGKSAIVFLTIFMIIFSGMWLAGGFAVSAQRNIELKQIKIDYTYYQDMIAFAEQQEKLTPNSGYIITGIVTGKFLSDYEDKWYLTYSFGGYFGTAYDGETYAIYDYEDVKSIIPNVTTIQLAADSNVITSTTDTINLDYKYTELKDDGYYLYIKKYNLLPQILCYCVGFGSAILFISLIINEAKKLKNKNSENAEQTENSLDKYGLPKNNQPTNNQSKHNYCDYCGTPIPEGKNKCPNCGAKQ